MGGFGNAALNGLIAFNILNAVVDKVVACVDMMCRDCVSNAKAIDNNEAAIRDYLFTNYLDNDEIMEIVGLGNFRFQSEVPENYISNRPIGRVDLQVYSVEEFRHRKRYFIIECKRVDGKLNLNRAYIDDGIRRFVGEKPRYTSYYKANCMLGFVVKDIDIDSNVDRINKLLENKHIDIPVHKYLQIQPQRNTYTSHHGCFEQRIILIHAFPKLFPIMRNGTRNSSLI